MKQSDLSVDTFMVLRNSLFEKSGKPTTFPLRDKKSTQDDPLDEYLHLIISKRLSDAVCLKAPGPLITPDLVAAREASCRQSSRKNLASDLTKIVAIEVKKLERRNGRIARSTGLDYNTTPPCGTVRIYDSDKQPVDTRCFYLFVCMEIAPKEKGRYYLSALALCDGDLLNDDFDYYLSIVGRRTKEIGLGTYGNGANRNRPMLIFASPLGISQLDRKVTLIHSSDQLAAVYKGLRLTYLLQRTTKSGQARKFYCYQSESDVPSDWSVRTLSNPFPEVDREQRTQPRGKFRLNFRTLE